MNGRFDGSIIFVTGGGSGIGLAAARAFASEGGRLTIADLDGDKANAAAEAIRADGGEAVAIATDVADPAACATAVGLAVAQWGRLDIAFNNAGMPSRIQPEFEDFSFDEWRRLIDVNLGGVFNCMKAEVPAMKAGGGGAIVNTASVASIIAAPGMAAYVASKHGVAGLTKAAALDLIRHRIRVNAICPGMIDTPMLGPLVSSPELSAAMSGQIPAGRMGRPEEMANAVLFLASDAASYLVGALLTADGGVSIQ